MPRRAREVNVIRMNSEMDRVGQMENQIRRLRVAAYCRVSTDEEEQESSYNIQIDYYTDLIQNNPEWIFVGVYADEGITGTSTKKRDDFNRLIRDCMAGRIDLIITKSISRFARNTLDCLVYVRKLKEIGVAVYFEKENLNTMDENSEMVLTILSSLAQEESRSISTNVHWGIAKRYEKGEVRVNTNRFLGFTRNDQHDLVPDIEEAITVRRIFRYYYEGNSVGVIKKRMEEEGFETGAGKKQWWASAIDRILDNEKYMGDALLQKTYTVDFLTKKRVKNTGQLNQYYVTDCVDALIPKKIYFKVQEMKAEKKTLGDRSSKQQNQVKGRKKSKYVLSDILVCAECGHYYRRVPWTNRQGEKRYVWRCINRLEHGTEYCKNSPTIDEKKIQREIMQTLGKLSADCSEEEEMLKAKLLDSRAIFYEAYDDDELEHIVEALNERYEYYQKVLAEPAADRKDVARRMRIVEGEIRDITEARQQIAVYRDYRQRSGSFVKNDEVKKRYRDFDDVLVRRLVKRVEIVNQDKCNVVLNSGQTIGASMEMNT